MEKNVQTSNPTTEEENVKYIILNTGSLGVQIPKSHIKTANEIYRLKNK